MVESRPALIGSRQIFNSSFSPSALVLEEKDFLSYRKSIYTAALPRYELGELGQLTHRQLNSAVPMLRFDWELLLEDDKKESLEGIVSTQQRNYARNNVRNDTDIVLTDEKFAGLELNGFARAGSTIKTTGTQSSWKFSQYVIKFIEFRYTRFDRDFWKVDMAALESEFRIS